MHRLDWKRLRVIVLGIQGHFTLLVKDVVSLQTRISDSRHNFFLGGKTLILQKDGCMGGTFNERNSLDDDGATMTKHHRRGHMPTKFDYHLKRTTMCIALYTMNGADHARLIMSPSKIQLQA